MNQSKNFLHGFLGICIELIRISPFSELVLYREGNHLLLLIRKRI